MNQLQHSNDRPNNSALHFEQLKRLCLELDPYAPISEELKKDLKSLGVSEFDDPFALTNELLKILDHFEQKTSHEKKRPTPLS